LHATTQAKDKVQCGLLLDVVVSKGSAILKLFTSKDKPLLIRWDPLLVLDLGLHIIDSVGALHFKGNCLSCECLHKDLHATTETENKVQCGLLLNVIISEGAAILKLLSSKNEPLLVRWNTLLILNFSFDIINGVRAFHF